MRPNAISLDSTLTLRAYVYDDRADTAVIKLDRVAAQQLAHALLEYSGVKAKSDGRENVTRIAAELAYLRDVNDLLAAFERVTLRGEK
jgi:hypothetical protein